MSSILEGTAMAGRLSTTSSTSAASPSDAPGLTQQPQQQLLRPTLSDRKPEDLQHDDQSDAGSRPSHNNCNSNGEDERFTFGLQSNDEAAVRAVAPFLAKHIPDQYAPVGLGSSSTPDVAPRNVSAKFCYRHRPDLPCRRTADAMSMELLQANLESLPQADQQAISHVWSVFSAAPAKHRNLMLQGILTQCCFPQLSYLSTSVRDLIRIDFVVSLPVEICHKILGYLDSTSLCKAACVSRKWRQMADDDVVWHKMCEQHIDKKCTKCGWGLPLLERKRLRDWKRERQAREVARDIDQPSPLLTPTLSPQPNCEVFQSQELATFGTSRKRSIAEDDEATPHTSLKRLRAHNLSVPDEGPNVLAELPSTHKRPKTRPWKEVYKDRFKVGSNWKYGRCQMKVFKGHANGVMCLQFDEQFLMTGSDDHTIKIWDIATGKVLRTLKGHTGRVRALQFDDTNLISGASDGMVKCWNWRTGKQLWSATPHPEGVMTLHFESVILATGSVDGVVRIWNFEDCSKVDTYDLTGHSDCVNAVKIDTVSRTVMSASDDCELRLWDLDTRRCIAVYHGHLAAVQQVMYLPADFELEEHTDTGNVPDCGYSANKISSQPADSGLGSDGTLDGNVLTTQSLSNGTELSATDSQSTTPYDETFPRGSLARALPPPYIATASLDGTVRLWDTATQQCLRTFFGHVDGVWALAGDKMRIVSGAHDCMIKVWDARTGKCAKTWTGHSGPVTCLGLSDSLMVSGSEDGDVRLWNFAGEHVDGPIVVQVVGGG